MMDSYLGREIFFKKEGRSFTFEGLGVGGTFENSYRMIQIIEQGVGCI